ncbi:hypothetical protein LTSEMON_4696 [Salmonella enterica subsp. enterica serovar Montevideo str. S5-403]|uniref:Smf/DprA SAM domain-containing protein n=1 Tax=Salmonella enterica subsp. enterica serovar Montevideo str. S5-403 TaxID=913242 RepID=G5Q8J1_SALMO|nr:hypothetical protein LTSEMON_4696 [Salmonella enterica subsp. enterica serovar Montevideo str. S5-403]
MARTEIWLRLMYVGDLYGEAMLNMGDLYGEAMLPIRLFASLR